MLQLTHTGINKCLHLSKQSQLSYTTTSFLSIVSSSIIDVLEAQLIIITGPIDRTKADWRPIVDSLSIGLGLGIGRD